MIALLYENDLFFVNTQDLRNIALDADSEKTYIYNILMAKRGSLKDLVKIRDIIYKKYSLFGDDQTPVNYPSLLSSIDDETIVRCFMFSSKYE